MLQGVSALKKSGEKRTGQGKSSLSLAVPSGSPGIYVRVRETASHKRATGSQRKLNVLQGQEHYWECRLAWGESTSWLPWPLPPLSLLLLLTPSFQKNKRQPRLIGIPSVGEQPSDSGEIQASGLHFCQAGVPAYILQLGEDEGEERVLARDQSVLALLGLSSIFHTSPHILRGDIQNDAPPHTRTSSFLKGPRRAHSYQQSRLGQQIRTKAKEQRST